MNRRLFAGGLVAASLARSSRATAQQSTPIASPEATPAAPFLLADQPGFVRAVVRNFEITEEGASAILEGGMILLQTFGVEFDTPDNASQGLAYLATALPESLAGPGSGATGVKTTNMEIGTPGEERIGLTVIVSLAAGELFDELGVAIAVVRKERFLQVLTGGGLQADWNSIGQVGSATDSRWPSDDLWDIVPLLEDIPVGMKITEEREILPDS